METRRESLLFWLNDFTPEEEEKVNEMSEVFNSKKFNLALSKLLPKELLPKEDDTIFYVYTVILTMLNRNGVGSSFQNALKTSSEENNEIVLFFLYSLFRQLNKDAEIKPQYSKAENMYQKWLEKQSTQTTTDFHFDSLASQIEEKNEHKKQKIKNLEKEYENQQRELEKVFDEVSGSFDLIIDEASKKAADEERRREALIQKRLEMDSKLSNLQERLRYINEQSERIPKIEKENENLSKQIEASKREKEILEEKQKEIAISGMTIQNLDEEIEALEEEIENLRTEYEALTNKQLENPEITESEIEKKRNLLKNLEEKVQKTDPETVIRQWQENLTKEIEKAKQERSKLELLIKMGQALI